MDLTSDPISKQKAGLRRKFRDLRGQFDAREKDSAAKALSQHLRRWLKDYTSSETQVAVYSPQADEAHFELGPSTQFFFPRIQGQEIEFFKPKANKDFEANRFGILEPKISGSQPLDLRLPVVVLCPAVAVDASGRRLGQGKGHYDRFFSAVPNATRVGVVYQVQVSIDPLPADSWDQLLDWIVTDKMILRTSRRSS